MDNSKIQVLFFVALVLSLAVENNRKTNLTSLLNAQTEKLRSARLKTC
jgi:hypothetical protein